MLRNYFTIAGRSFLKNKVFTLINMFGLAIGISAALVIYLIVSYEFSFNRFGKDDERIYRTVSIMHFPNQEFKNSGIAGPLAIAAPKELPGIETAAAFWVNSATKVTVPVAGQEDKVYKEQEGTLYADKNYFTLFPYKWLAGSPETALTAPYQVVLTESRAKQYFAYNDITQVIGRTISYDDSIRVTVSGVVQDIKSPTDFFFGDFISFATFNALGLPEKNSWDHWGSINSASQFFVKLQPGTNIPAFNSKMKELVTTHSKKESGLETDYFLQPLNDIHFNKDYDAFEQRQANKPTMYGLLAVAAFLLLLGCINFINLTTAQAMQRAKEIGIRKTMGSSKSQLVFQFLSETFLLTLMATGLSLLLTPWILHIFADYIPEGLTLSAMKQPQLWLFAGVLLVTVSFLSGFYPALVLSKYKPVQVLKGQAIVSSGTTRRALLRKTLTVAQFIIAQFFIIATLMVGKQIRYSMNKDLGFQKDAIVNFTAPLNYEKPDNKQYVLLEKLRALPGISKISLGGAPPASSNYSMSTMRVTSNGKETNTTVAVKMADSAYLGLYQMKLVAGRNLQNSDTTREYLINESYARFLGCKTPEDALKLSVNQGSWKAPIVGVLADFHAKSLREAIKPLVYTSQGKGHSVFHILLQPKGSDMDSWKKTIDQIQAQWKTIYPEQPFSYKFLDERIAAFYKSDQQIARLLGWATTLAIIISCLGLLGLVIYTTNQRVKEIGVRKVLGASITQLVTLLSKDFVKLVLLAFIITVPLAWWAMHTWLENFAYRTDLSWWVFAACGGMMLLIALLIMAVKTIRAAMSNPVNSLRSE